MSVPPYGGGAHQLDYLPGDVYPSNFSFRHPQLNQDLFRLWNRNEFVQLLIDWMPYEAFRRWVQFIEDESNVEGVKFGQPYTFKGYEYEDKNTGETISMTGFEEYCQWNKVPERWTLGTSMARLYPEGSLLVFLDDTEQELPIPDKHGKAYIQWKANPDPQGYFTFQTYQPLTVGDGTGYVVHKADPSGKVTEWKLQIMTETMKKGKTFIIDADRCHHLQWKKKSNTWKATSRVAGMAKWAQIANQIFEKLTKRAHDIAGGILEFTGIASEAEQLALDNAMGSDLTSVDRVYLQEGRTLEYKTPDLKASGEFSAIFDIITRILCRHMRVSQLILDGEHTGMGLGGSSDVEIMNSYSEIYQIQEHFRTDLEHVFYKLGKKNTSFIYNEILPEEMTVDENNPNNGESDNTNKDKGEADGLKEKPKESKKE